MYLAENSQILNNMNTLVLSSHIFLTKEKVQQCPKAERWNITCLPTSLGTLAELATPHYVRGGSAGLRTLSQTNTFHLTVGTPKFVPAPKRVLGIVVRTLSRCPLPLPGAHRCRHFLWVGERAKDVSLLGGLRSCCRDQRWVFRTWEERGGVWWRLRARPGEVRVWGGGSQSVRGSGSGWGSGWHHVAPLRLKRDSSALAAPALKRESFGLGDSCSGRRGSVISWIFSR